MSTAQSPTVPQLINLRAEEAAVLNELAAEQHMTPEQVLRQALRLYQHNHLMAKAGAEAVYLDGQGEPVQRRLCKLAA